MLRKAQFLLLAFVRALGDAAGMKQDRDIPLLSNPLRPDLRPSPPSGREGRSERVAAIFSAQPRLLLPTKERKQQTDYSEAFSLAQRCQL